MMKNGSDECCWRIYGIYVTVIIIVVGVVRNKNSLTMLCIYDMIKLHNQPARIETINKNRYGLDMTMMMVFIHNNYHKGKYKSRGHD